MATTGFWIARLISLTRFLFRLSLVLITAICDFIEEEASRTSFRRLCTFFIATTGYFIKKYPGLQVFLFSLVEVWLLDIFGC